MSGIVIGRRTACTITDAHIQRCKGIALEVQSTASAVLRNVTVENCNNQEVSVFDEATVSMSGVKASLMAVEYGAIVESIADCNISQLRLYGLFCLFLFLSVSLFFCKNCVPSHHSLPVRIHYSNQTLQDVQHELARLVALLGATHASLLPTPYAKLRIGDFESRSEFVAALLAEAKAHKICTKTFTGTEFYEGWIFACVLFVLAFTPVARSLRSTIMGVL